MAEAPTMPEPVVPLTPQEASTSTVEVRPDSGPPQTPEPQALLPLPQEESPPWSPLTKAIVAVTGLVLAGLLVWRFRTLIQPLVLAMLLAYLTHPLITQIDRRTRLHRSGVVLLVYSGLALAVLVGLSAVGFTTFQQAVVLSQRVPTWFEQAVALAQTLPERLPEAVAIGPAVLPLERLWPQLPNGEVLAAQLVDLIRPIFTRGGSLAAGIVSATVNVVGWLFFISVISIYIAIDLPHFSRAIAHAAQQTGYRADAERLMAQISRVWGAYLRGQVILALVIFAVVSLVLSLLDVSNALGLGLLAGAMEFLPIIGPLVAGGAAVLVALFQPENVWGLSPVTYVLAVAGAMFLIQQLENNILVPRIVGGALDLHPLLVMISVLMGASLAGILGAILAAPVVASLKILGRYTWRKMLDLPPFPEIPVGSIDPPGGG